MKKIFVCICAALAISYVFAEESNGLPQQTCQTEEMARANATDDQLAQMPLCCCSTAGGGQCCNYQSACLGLVKGCVCVGRAVESEPTNSDASEAKIRI